MFRSSSSTIVTPSELYVRKITGIVWPSSLGFSIYISIEIYLGVYGPKLLIVSILVLVSYEKVTISWKEISSSPYSIRLYVDLSMLKLLLKNSLMLPPYSSELVKRKLKR